METRRRQVSKRNICPKLIHAFFVDLLYFGDTIVELPSFEPFTKCKVAPHPVKDLGVAVTGLLDGKVITCGGEILKDKLIPFRLTFCLLH